MPAEGIDVLSGALAPSICPGCRHFRINSVKISDTGAIASSPCRYFEPRNFYYDGNIQRYWCRLWEDSHGRVYPEPRPESVRI